LFLVMVTILAHMTTSMLSAKDKIGTCMYLKGNANMLPPSWSYLVVAMFEIFPLVMFILGLSLLVFPSIWLLRDELRN